MTLHQPSLEPDDEAKKDHTADQERSYASQVFQLTAANVHWFGAQRDFMGSPMQPGSLGYTQLPSERGYKLNGDGRFFDTGERLFDMSGDKPKLVTKDPGVRIGVLEHLANLISGDDDKGFVIEHRIGAAREGTATFGSAAELEKLLVDSKESFPLILRVHSANEPFNRCDGDWHAINIVAYDPATKKVSISNQWGKDSDRQVKLDQLYRASQESTTRFKCTPDESWPGSNPSSPGLPQRMGLPNNG